jgi:hypothetical protein
MLASVCSKGVWLPASAAAAIGAQSSSVSPCDAVCSISDSLCVYEGAQVRDE